MSWNHIPDIDSSATTSEDNPFAGPKLHTPGKVSVNLPTDEWSASVYKGWRYHPYERQDSRSNKQQDRPAWKNLSRTQHRKNKGKQQYSWRPAIPLSYANPVTNAPNVAMNLPVGARLQIFWKKWLDLGAGPKVIQILKEGYTSPSGPGPTCQEFPQLWTKMPEI